MSGSRELAEHLEEILGDIDGLDRRPFFGGWSLLAHGTQFAIVMDTLYLRVGEPLRAALRDAGSRPFCYRARGREVRVERYWAVPDEALDDPGALRRWARRAIAAQAPVPPRTS